MCLLPEPTAARCGGGWNRGNAISEFNVGMEMQMQKEHLADTRFVQNKKGCGQPSQRTWYIVVLTAMASALEAGT